MHATAYSARAATSTTWNPNAIDRIVDSTDPITEKNPSRPASTKFIMNNSPCYVGFNKDEPALKAKVNEIIAKAKADGTLNKFSEKWLKNPLPAGF